MRNSFPLKAIVLMVLFMIPEFTFANFVGNDTSNFNPIPSGIDFVTVHSSETLSYGLLNTSYFINYAKNSLPATFDPDGNKITSIDSILFSDLSLAYGLTESFEIGTSLSYLLNQTVDRSESGAQFAGTGLNEIRILGKYNLLKRNPLGLALVTTFNINQAENNPFSGKGAGPTTNIEIILDYRWDKVILSSNLGYRFRKQGTLIENAVYEPLGDQVIGSLGMSYYFSNIDTRIMAEVFAAKALRSTTHVNSNRISSEALFGVKYDATRNASVNLGAGTKISEGLFTPDWRVYAGINITLDALNKPSGEISSSDVELKLEYYKGYLPNDIEALKTKSFEDIAKRHEFLLRTTVPEKDFQGQKPPFEIIRLDGFDFDFGSSQIRSEYYPLLERLAAYLNSAPGVLKIRVEGHTDSLGSLDRNKIVSQERADNVAAHLAWVAKLKDVRIDSIGFGAEKPIADNGNFQGRKQNRRVEIRILRKITKPPERIK